jgi:gentisate 1,2-dioxygenase
MNTVREPLLAELKAQGLAPLWTTLHDLVPRIPTSRMRPAHWTYDLIRPLLMRAGEAISAEEAIRRVLILENPGAAGTGCITDTLYAGLQLILPGEVAPAHRHSQSAFRFIVEGQGAYTTVRGERFDMEPGDLILTPNFEWHDHGHQGNDAVVWLDGLDIPLVRSLAAGFAENFALKQQALVTAPGTNAAQWGSGLRPIGAKCMQGPRRVERIAYRFSEWRGALTTLARSGSPPGVEGFELEFVNPVDGSSVLPTMSAFCQLLPKGYETSVLRRTDGRIFTVVEGSGRVYAGGCVFRPVARDVFVIPSWIPYSIHAEEQLVLFSYSDRATQERLGLWRHSIDCENALHDPPKS